MKPFWWLWTLFWTPDRMAHKLKNGRGFVCGRWHIPGRRGRVGTSSWSLTTCPECLSDPNMESERKAQEEAPKCAWSPTPILSHERQSADDFLVAWQNAERQEHDAETETMKWTTERRIVARATGRDGAEYRIEWLFGELYLGGGWASNSGLAVTGRYVVYKDDDPIPVGDCESYQAARRLAEKADAPPEPKQVKAWWKFW